MPKFIEEFYYGNIELQESNKEFKTVLKKKLDCLSEAEKELSEKSLKKRVFFREIH